MYPWCSITWVSGMRLSWSTVDWGISGIFILFRGSDGFNGYSGADRVNGADRGDSGYSIDSNYRGGPACQSSCTENPVLALLGSVEGGMGSLVGININSIWFLDRRVPVIASNSLRSVSGLFLCENAMPSSA